MREQWCLRFSWEHGFYLWELQNQRLWNISFGLIINLQGHNFGQNIWDKCGDIGNNLENGHMGTWRVHW